MQYNVPPLWHCAPKRCLPVRRFWILTAEKNKNMLLPDLLQLTLFYSVNTDRKI